MFVNSFIFLFNRPGFVDCETIFSFVVDTGFKILLVGLGGGSLATFIHKHFPKVTSVLNLIFTVFLKSKQSVSKLSVLC